MLSGMLAAEHVAEALAEGRANDELAELRGGVARRRRSARDLWKVRNVKPLWSKLGTFLGIAARRPRHVDQHARLLAVRHARPRQARRRDAEAGGASASRSPIRKPDGKLTFDRLSSVFLSNTNHEEDQPLHLQRRRHGAAEGVRARRLCRAVGALLPGRRLRMGRGGRRAALRDQRAELRPLQNLRHQGPQPEHHLGAAGGRRRAEILRICDRRFRGRRSRYRHTGDSAWCAARRRRRCRVLAGRAAKRPFCARTRRAGVTAAHGGSHS